MSMNIDIGHILDKVKIGNSFRVVGGISLLISIWANNILALKISLITFIFGAFARTIEILNRLYPKNTLLHFLIWITFIIVYAYFINNHIQLY